MSDSRLSYISYGWKYGLSELIDGESTMISFQNIVKKINVKSKGVIIYF